VIPLLLALGCAPEEATHGPMHGAAPPTSEVAAVVSSVYFVGETEGVTEGFNLDGAVTDAGDASGCGHADLVDDEGNEGIDNAFAGLVPVLLATEASALQDLLAQSIANGELLLLVELSNVDGELGADSADWDDDCVDMTLWRGLGTPLLASDGTVLDHQTFETSEPVTVECVPMVDGRAEAQGFSVTLPAQVLDVELTLHLADAALRIERLPDGGFQGILAGGIPRSDFDAILSEPDIQDLQQLLTPLVAGLSDLEPDADGVCQAMSISLGFDALPAFVSR
jgi:hypothetical protein